MELNFGENIKRLRRSRDLTQETLADALGVSAQSVSKWECAYGYPDITQLPAIANYFGVTIDELLNNDEEGRKNAAEYFDAHVHDFDDASEEKIDFVLGYCRRYPEEPRYAYILCTNISCHITRICPQNRDKYYPLLRQTAKKLIDNVEYRGVITAEMINACPEEELDEWLNIAPYSSNLTRRNCMISRCITIGDEQGYGLHFSLGNLETFAIQLDSRYPDSAGPIKKGLYHKKLLDIIASFGENGEIPDGWLAYYAYKQLVYAACLFGAGNADEGKRAFLGAVEKLQRYHSLSEEYLDMGASFFGGIRVDREWHYAMDENGEKYRMYGTVPRRLFGKADYILGLLTNSRWAWFNSARNEDYYKNAVKWLEGIVAKTAHND